MIPTSLNPLGRGREMPGYLTPVKAVIPDGRCIIPTGIIINGSESVVLKISTADLSRSQAIVVSLPSTAPRFDLWVLNNSHWPKGLSAGTRIGDGYSAFKDIIKEHDDYKIEYNPRLGRLMVDNQEYTYTESNKESNAELSLLGQVGRDEEYWCIYPVLGVLVKKANDLTISDMRPVVDSTGVAGMYDIVRRRLLLNSGSGDLRYEL